jgi:hypothetical protein
MTSPSNPQNNTDAASPTAGYDFDALAKKDSSELLPHEAEALAYWRSEQSLREYDPSTVAPEERIVELPDRASVTLGEVAAGKTADGEEIPSNLQAEAAGMIESLKADEETPAAPVEAAPAESTPAPAPSEPSSTDTSNS